MSSRPTSHPLSNQEVLFTRQRHEADKMGLHWDYRFVLGDKAYSWATKKEMPEPGKAILLFEQPVHDREYALSPVVKIPSGNYGAGTTTLDWVHKALVDGYEDEPGKLIIRTKDGKQRFLLKKLDKGAYFEKYGDKAWLFRNLGAQSPEYKEGSDSTFTHDGITRRVDSLIEIAKDKPTKQISVGSLDWILKHTDVDPTRAKEADLAAPIILSNFKGKLAVIDGAHRLTKAVNEGVEKLPTKYVTREEILGLDKSASLKATIKPMTSVTRISTNDLAPVLGTGPLGIQDVADRLTPLHNYDPTSFLASEETPSRAGILTKVSHTMTNNKFLTKLAFSLKSVNYPEKKEHYFDKAYSEGNPHLRSALSYYDAKGSVAQGHPASFKGKTIDPLDNYLEKREGKPIVSQTAKNLSHGALAGGLGVLGISSLASKRGFGNLSKHPKLTSGLNSAALAATIAGASSAIGIHRKEKRESDLFNSVQNVSDRIKSQVMFKAWLDKKKSQ